MKAVAVFAGPGPAMVASGIKQHPLLIKKKKKVWVYCPGEPSLSGRGLAGGQITQRPVLLH